MDPLKRPSVIVQYVFPGLVAASLLLSAYFFYTSFSFTWEAVSVDGLVVEIESTDSYDSDGRHSASWLKTSWGTGRRLKPSDHRIESVAYFLQLVNFASS